MYKGRRLLKELLEEQTGCTMQHDGWTCGTCFFPIIDEIKGLSDDDDHNYWLAVLAVRGDYNDFDWKKQYPDKDVIEFAPRLASELIQKLDI